MRWSVMAVLGLLLLSGCAAHKPPAAVAGPGAQALADSRAAPDGAPANDTLTRMRFAGDTAEATLPVAATYAITDQCNFSFGACPPGATKTFDLTSLVPPNVPVELTASVTGDAGYTIYLDFKDAEAVRYSSKYNQGTQSIDATLVRATTGTVDLVMVFYGPDYGNPQQTSTIQGAVHTVARTSVVPAYMPVAVTLGPGDRINATGDGLEQLALFPPAGAPLRTLVGPYNLTVPAGYPAGTYILVAQAEEAVQLYGPNRTLSARLLEFTQGSTVDIASGADTSFDVTLPGQPLLAGVEMMSKGTVGDASLLPMVTTHTVSLQAPGNVEVLSNAGTDCGPIPCGLGIFGQMGWGYSSEFLDEHLVAGTYHGTIHMQASNNMQAYAWGLTVRNAA